MVFASFPFACCALQLLSCLCIAIWDGNRNTKENISLFDYN